jgi:hypothetical protein
MPVMKNLPLVGGAMVHLVGDAMVHRELGLRQFTISG